MSFCTAKEATDKMDRQSLEWEKIFANNANGLISKIHKQLDNNKKQTTQPKNGQKTEIDIFRTYRCQKAHEKMLNITISEMQMKTTIRYHFTEVRMATIKKSTNN